MFGIDDALIWMPLAGAVAGGLLNKKKPLEGALLGAGIGATGGLLAPAAGGAAATAAGGAALDAGVAQGAALASGGTGSLTGGAAMDAAIANGAKSAVPQMTSAASTPVRDGLYNTMLGMNSAAAAKNLFYQPQQQMPITPSPVTVGQGSGTSLAQIAASGDQKAAQIQQEALARKQRRMGLLGVA